MNAKQRIERAEKALDASGGVRLEWVEPDENGNFPPVEPGEKVKNLKWDGGDPDPVAVDSALFIL